MFNFIRKIGIIIGSLFLLQSCLPSLGTKYLIKNSKLNLESANISGIYKNTTEVKDGISLWKALQANSKKSNDTIDLKTDIIKLELISSKELEVSLIRDKKAVKKFILTGKIKENTFSLKRYRRLIPFYPIYAEDYEAKALLSKADNHLVLVQGISNSGAILIMGAGYQWVQTFTYEEVKN